MKKSTCFKLIPEKLGEALEKLAKDRYWPSLFRDDDSWTARAFTENGEFEVAKQPTAVIAIQSLYIAIAKAEAEEQTEFEREATESIYK